LLSGCKAVLAKATRLIDQMADTRHPERGGARAAAAADAEREAARARAQEAQAGEVNGANGFGGYAGWTTFIAVGSGISFAPTEEGPMADHFETTFDKWCRRGMIKAAVEL
jgi:hypothetical protein